MVAIGRTVQVQGRGGNRLVRSMGRKDRHSKVFTSKGPRDRRVRLSALTAIQFYDVQDRLGFDRPSEAVDWLIQKARASIEALNREPSKGHQKNDGLLGDCPLTTNQGKEGVENVTAGGIWTFEDKHGHEGLQYYDLDSSVNNDICAFGSTEKPLHLFPSLMEHATAEMNSSYASFESEEYPVPEHVPHSDENIMFWPLPHRPEQGDDHNNSLTNSWFDKEVFSKCEFQKMILSNQKFSFLSNCSHSRDLSTRQATATEIREANGQSNQVNEEA